MKIGWVIYGSKSVAGARNEEPHRKRGGILQLNAKSLQHDLFRKKLDQKQGRFLTKNLPIYFDSY